MVTLIGWAQAAIQLPANRCLRTLVAAALLAGFVAGCGGSASGAKKTAACSQFNTALGAMRADATIVNFPMSSQTRQKLIADAVSMNAALARLQKALTNPTDVSAIRLYGQDVNSFQRGVQALADAPGVSGFGQFVAVTTADHLMHQQAPKVAAICPRSSSAATSTSTSSPSTTSTATTAAAPTLAQWRAAIVPLNRLWTEANNANKAFVFTGSNFDAYVTHVRTYLKALTEYTDALATLTPPPSVATVKQNYIAAVRSAVPLLEQGIRAAIANDAAGVHAADQATRANAKAELPAVNAFDTASGYQP
jgi:hypothetical protein